MARSSNELHRATLTELIKLVGVREILVAELRSLHRAGLPEDDKVLELASLDEKIEHYKELLHLEGVVTNKFDLIKAATASKKSAGIAVKADSKWAPPVSHADTQEIDTERLHHDFEYFCLICVTITYRPGMLASHPGGGYGPMILTEAQKMVAAVLVRYMLIDRVPTRVIVLKSRQLGCTTLLLAFWCWIMLTHDHFHVMFIIDKAAHGNTKRQELIRWFDSISKKFDHFPSVEKKDEKYIRLTNGSMFFFESAEAPNPGTSEMLHGLHESEKPKWPAGRALQVEASITPSIPASAGTLHVDESTAMGQDDFSAKWDLACKPSSDAHLRWVPIFLPWFISPEYAQSVPADFVWLNSDDEVSDFSLNEAGEEILLTEQEYALKYHLTREQVYWRRVKIKQSFKGNRSLFDQEFPTTPAHAWRSTLQGFFPRRMLDRAEATVRPPVLIDLYDAHGYTDHNNVLLYHKMTPMLRRHPQGEVRVFIPPFPGQQYFAGMDVAEGKATINVNGETAADWSSCSIKDENGTTVAIWLTRQRVETLWLPLVLLLLYYNKAWLNGERNAPGLVLLVQMLKTGYPHMLVNQRPEGRPIEDRAWTTVNRGNRETMLTELRASYNLPDYEIFSGELLSEMRTFIRRMLGGTSKLEAKAGSHDDILFGDMHAEHMRRQFRTVGVAREIVPPPVEVDTTAAPRWDDSIFYCEDDDHGKHNW